MCFEIPTGFLDFYGNCHNYLRYIRGMLVFSVLNNLYLRGTTWWDLRIAAEEIEYGGEALYFGAVPMLRKTLQCRWWCFPPRY